MRYLLEDVNCTSHAYCFVLPRILNDLGHAVLFYRMATARENTVRSLCEAAKNGADYVEFDVQLTKVEVRNAKLL